MRVLLIGSGAREHAIGWKLENGGRVSELLSLPGNPGLARLGPLVEGVSDTDVGAIAAIARIHKVDLVVVGPEAPLAAGVADAVSRLGIPVFGPSRSAARLESSKSFAKQVMSRAGVPTPAYEAFEEPEPARAYLNRSEGPFVVKADGLAGGKGVLVTDDRDAAIGWIDRCFDGDFGAAGSRVVIEDHVEGPELSVFAICDGETAVTLEPARDYKRLLDGDRGPNTGGMGSYSPVDLPVGLVDEVKRRVIEPTLRQMAEDGTPYRGFLYAGLVLTADGPQVIEFNVRLGDPETQVVLPRLDNDLLGLIEAAISGRLADVSLSWRATAAVNVVLASAGYPDGPRKGDRIHGLAEAERNAIVFQAGTAEDEGGHLVTNGGRVLSVVGTGPSVDEARTAAYAAARSVSWPGVQLREDIGEK